LVGVLGCHGDNLAVKFLFYNNGKSVSKIFAVCPLPFVIEVAPTIFKSRLSTLVAGGMLGMRSNPIPSLNSYLIDLIIFTTSDLLRFII
jgi:hypothetical protein